MSAEFIAALALYAVKFGLDAAIILCQSVKVGATIDDAIAALEKAKTKTAADYLAEAKAKLPT